MEAPIAQEAITQPKAPRRWPLIMLLTTVSVGACAYIVTEFFSSSILRYILKVSRPRLGYSIEAEVVEGSLLRTKTVHLKKVKIIDDTGRDNVDMKCDEVTTKYKITSLFPLNIECLSLNISGVTGRITIPNNIRELLPFLKHHEDKEERDGWSQKKRSLKIDELHARDINLSVSDRSHFRDVLNFRIDHFNSGRQGLTFAHNREREIGFEILNSNASGSINGCPFDIQTDDQLPNSYRSNRNFTNIPHSFLQRIKLIHFFPTMFVETGHVDLHSSVGLENGTMNYLYQFAFRGVSFKGPKPRRDGQEDGFIRKTIRAIAEKPRNKTVSVTWQNQSSAPLSSWVSEEAQAFQSQFPTALKQALLNRKSQKSRRSQRAYHQ